MNDIKEINDIVKPSYVKIMPLTKSLECEWTKKSPLNSNQRIWYCECPPPHTLDIDDSGGNTPCSLSDVAKCSRILDKNAPLGILPDSNTEYTSDI